MHGPNPYIAKVMSIFFNMDNMIGKDFESGLANLKTNVQGEMNTAENNGTTNVAKNVEER
jgi:hypothetical protein